MLVLHQEDVALVELASVALVVVDEVLLVVDVVVGLVEEVDIVLGPGLGHEAVVAFAAEPFAASV